ncbi:M23 family metallopeptidase [Kineobactrum salinum]|uniref:M23 family metallopeptidase n=1 Tax=Kineobactrum salinum TaxID=2708301 RepID=UPI002F960C8A
MAQALAGFSWPVEGRISGVYGSQRIYNGKPGSPHYGVDVAVPTGTEVRAPAAGVVTLAEPDLFYSGGTIILDHGYLLSSSFLHLSKLHVAVGDEVEPGDLIAEVGATGRATGPHLDWRMSWRSARIDPQFLVPPMPQP